VISNVANDISAYLEPYSSLKIGGREDHLRELCRLGAELRGHMKSHPSAWTFGSWNEAGFIMMFPSLLKDNGQEVDRQIFWIA